MAHRFQQYANVFPMVGRKLLLFLALAAVPTPLQAALTPAGLLCGVDYGPYREGQSPDPGIHPTPAQLREDMIVVARLGCSLRTFSVLNGFDQIPAYGAEHNLKVVPGGLGKQKRGRQSGRNYEARRDCESRRQRSFCRRGVRSHFPL